MAYPTLIRTSTTGGALATTHATTLIGHTDSGDDGLYIIVVSTRVAADISIIANGTGWFKLGEIQRTSGAIGTTAVFGRYYNGSAFPNPTFGSNTVTTTLWRLTHIVLSGANTIPSTQQFSLGTSASATAQATTSITQQEAESLFLGGFADSRTTTLTGTPASGTTEYVDTMNTTYDIWHYVGYKELSSPGSSTTIGVTPSTTASMREWIIEIGGLVTNTPPTFSIQPSFATGRTYAFGPAGAIPDVGAGAGNGGTISFRATDAEETGANALTYEIRSSAAPGAGTLMGSGTCTSGVTKTHAIFNSTTGFTSNGDKSVYVHVSDGTNTTVSSLLTIRVDESSPAAVTSISTDPATVNDYERYRVIFTPNDTTSPDAGVLRYEIRTGTNGAGTQLASGSATNAVAVTTAFFNDTALVDGANTRYIRVQDAGGNITQTTFTVTKTATRVWDQISDISTGANDGYAMWPTGTGYSSTAGFIIIGWGAASQMYASWLRYPLNAEPTYTIDYATIRMAQQGTFAGTINVRIRGVLQLNPSAPATAAALQALPLTTASVSLSTASLDVDGEPVELPDLSAIIEEIMAQPGWTSGNYIMFVLDTTTSYVNTTYQQRWDSFEVADTTPRFYVDWTAEVIYDEVSTSANVIYVQTTGSVDARVIDATGGDHVIMGSFEGGSDGLVWVDTGTVAVIYASTTGVNTATQDDLAAVASMIYANTSSSVLALNMSVQGQEGVLAAFTGGSDVGTFIETEGSVEAIVEASSSLEDHDMNEPATVSVVYVRASGFDQMEGQLDESNPVIIYVETMGEDAFDLGPQVYDEATIDVTVVIFPILSGEEIATMHDLLDVDVYHVETNFSIEFFQGRFEEFNDPVVIGMIESGDDTMVMNASVGEVFEIPVVTTSSVHEQHMFEPTGVITMGFNATSSVETYVHGETGGIILIDVVTGGAELTGYVELTGEVIIPIQTHADEGMLMYETTGETIIDVVTQGYEGNLVEDMGGITVINVVTDGAAEVYRIRVPSRYYRSALVVDQPYEHSTLAVVSLYSRSSLVSTHQMRESLLAAT